MRYFCHFYPHMMTAADCIRKPYGWERIFSGFVLGGCRLMYSLYTVNVMEIKGSFWICENGDSMDYSSGLKCA